MPSAPRYCSSLNPSPHRPRCGPVEASKPVAEAHAFDYLRTVRGAAPLKHVGWVTTFGLSGYLRTVRGAAPLKHRFITEQEALAEESPHRPRCGPVEALEAGRQGGSNAGHLRTVRGAAPLKQLAGPKTEAPVGNLRTVRGAAPLKRSTRPGRSRLQHLSPHRPRCGPVEASSLYFCLRRSTANLRTVRGAAPLKPHPWRACGASGQIHLRTVRGAAPLKHARVASRLGAAHLISAPSAVRPR